jgi:hypothetical protein
MVGITGLLLLALLAPLLTGALWVGWQTQSHLNLYREMGEWLEDRTPAEASVGALEVGIIGYYAKRDMIGFAGLIQPEVAHQLTSGSTYEESVTWAIQAYEPDYVVLDQKAAHSPARQDWFREGYQPVRDFANPGEEWMTLYRRRDAE